MAFLALTSGLRGEDPTIAELLKPLGYATGQFGKNHFGDKDEFLPTNHGFKSSLAISIISTLKRSLSIATIRLKKDFPKLSQEFQSHGE